MGRAWGWSKAGRDRKGGSTLQWAKVHGAGKGLLNA